MSEPETHDYTVRGWGHNYNILDVKRGGRLLKLSGWGDGIHTGDYLILVNRDASGTVRYRVKGIRYCTDPTDMWFADVTFAPRKA